MDEDKMQATPNSSWSDYDESAAPPCCHPMAGITRGEFCVQGKHGASSMRNFLILLTCLTTFWPQVSSAGTFIPEEEALPLLPIRSDVAQSIFDMAYGERIRKQKGDNTIVRWNQSTATARLGIVHAEFDGTEEKTAVPSGWEKLASGAYIHEPTIVATEHGGRAWISVDHDPPQLLESGHVVGSELTLFEYDCKQLRVRFLAFRMYEGPRGSGEAILHLPMNDPKWSFMAPGAHEDSFQMVCRAVSR